MTQLAAPPWSPIGWMPDHSIRLLDQTLLPNEERYITISAVDQMAEAIRFLRVRGAPLIGIAAAMGASLAALPRRIPSGPGRANALRRGPRTRLGASADGALQDVLQASDGLQATRPTAVNLAWALERVRGRARAAAAAGEDLHAALVAEATAIWDEDRAMCDRIGEAGLHLVPDGATVLTHCNAGALATGGIGTALAPVYRAHAAGRKVNVVADETRPLLQGSRLTAWELARAGILTTVITDGMVASRLRRGDIACVLVGADRIARNGDVANKIGTYTVALAARSHGVPFYVAAPRSTFDPATPNGAAIPIEERLAEEVRHSVGGANATRVEVWNPAFDVTPAELITGYITDAGLLTRDQLGSLCG